MQSIASVAASLPFFGVTSTMVCDDEGVDAIIDDRHEKHCIVAKGHNTGTRQKINVMVNVFPSRTLNYEQGAAVDLLMLQDLFSLGHGAEKLVKQG